MKMVSMILDGCKDLDEAKEKIKELAEEQKKKRLTNQSQPHTNQKGGLVTALSYCIIR